MQYISFSRKMHNPSAFSTKISDFKTDEARDLNPTGTYFHKKLIGTKMQAQIGYAIHYEDRVFQVIDTLQLTTHTKCTTNKNTNIWKKERT